MKSKEHSGHVYPEGVTQEAGVWLCKLGSSCAVHMGWGLQQEGHGCTQHITKCVHCQSP
jgi:hypothetical protein